MGSKVNQNLISSQILAFPPFSPLFFLKNEICSSNENPKTTFGLLNPLKCKALFGLHTYYHFFFSFFLSFWS